MLFHTRPDKKRAQHTVVYHANGDADKRYSVTLEHTGKEQPIYAVRFCGAFIGSATLFLTAGKLARRHNTDRMRIYDV